MYFLSERCVKSIGDARGIEDRLPVFLRPYLALGRDRLTAMEIFGVQYEPEQLCNKNKNPNLIVKRYIDRQTFVNQM